MLLLFFVDLDPVLYSSSSSIYSILPNKFLDWRLLFLFGELPYFVGLTFNVNISY